MNKIGWRHLWTGVNYEGEDISSIFHEHMMWGRRDGMMSIQLIKQSYLYNVFLQVKHYSYKGETEKDILPSRNADFSELEQNLVKS